jgi:hypothetical protein
MVGPALADSITGGSGPTVTSINDGPVTATGKFGHTSINGGTANFIGVTATGAAVTIQITRDGVDSSTPNNDSISVSTINAQNGTNGTITANGTFNGTTVSGTNNSAGVSAAGTSVTISITKR